MKISRRFIRNLLLFLVLGLMAIFRVVGSDLVWRVQSGGNRIYLAGSIHLLRASDYPIPDSFDTAFQAARCLILETDIDQVASTSFQQYYTDKATYPVGVYLASRISSQLYGYVRGYAAQNGLVSTAFDTYRPWFVANYISANRFIGEGLSPDMGVDRHYLNLANQKQRKFLETPQQQIDAISGSLETDSIKGLSALAGLLPASQYPVQTGAQLIAKWRSGKIRSFDENINLMFRETPSSYENLIRKRNQAWMPQIEAQLKSGDVAMVLVC